MLEIDKHDNGTVVFAGRLDASQADKAQTYLDQSGEVSVIDFARLEYISSAGLGILLRTQKRLMSNGGGLRLINVNSHIRDVFHYSGFDRIFEIEAS